MFSGNPEGHKQYLLLSQYAQDIIEYDMYIFMDKTNRDGFINEIVSNFMDQADASISLRLEEKRDQLMKLGDISDSSFIKFIDKVVEQYRDELLEKISYDKGKRFPAVRINKRNSSRIYQNPECSESDFYGDKPGAYIRALIEEYAQLPFSERERIMIGSKIRFIQSAIDSNTILKITISNGKCYRVRPYLIALDEQHRYHYLVGMSKPYESDTSLRKKAAEGIPTPEEKVASFRISRIIDVQERKDHSGKIRFYDEKELKKRLATSGIMYAVEEAETVTFKLTESGLEKYNSRFNQRPRIKKISEDNIYEAVVTNRQIHNYFFDFGADIEIISPLYLREQFITRYQDALSNYQSDHDSE